MNDSRVDAAIKKLEPLTEFERRRAAAGSFEAQAVLILAGLHTEAKMVGSVSHMVTERAFVTLTGVAEERGREARDRLVSAGQGGRLPCVGRLCEVVNQGPCGCNVPAAVAELRRRQRALLWACEAMMRPTT